MKIIQIFIAVTLVFLMGCAPKTMYHWGNYSDSLYTYTKEPSNETRTNHKAELVELIEEASKSKMLVPPGIYFEIAMIESEDGNHQLALAHFEKEVTLFPESKKYVELAIKVLEAK